MAASVWWRHGAHEGLDHLHPRLVNLVEAVDLLADAAVPALCVRVAGDGKQALLLTEKDARSWVRSAFQM